MAQIELDRGGVTRRDKRIRPYACAALALPLSSIPNFADRQILPMLAQRRRQRAESAGERHQPRFAAA